MGRQALTSKGNITFLFSLLLSLLLSLQYCSSTTDTITVNRPLKDGDLLISKAKSYALGFFTPGNSTDRRYVGIWYRQIPDQMVVWVANRNSPVNGTSGVLFIDVTGNLVIQDSRTNISVWNTSLDFPATTAPSKAAHSARIQERNLVLYRGDQTAAWQSFDYPTNTLLAHMRLGMDTKRGLNLSITSWKSADDPAVGDYALSVQMKGKPQAFLFKDSTRAWRLGSWNGIRWSGLPEMTPDATPYVFTENDDQATEEYSIKDPNMYTIVMLNETGTLNKIIWQGEDGDETKKWVGNWFHPYIADCDVYGHCGAFGICNPYGEQSGFFCRCVPGFEPKVALEWNRSDGSHGCRRPAGRDLLCRHGEGFLKLENAKIPDTEMAQVNKSIGLDECENLCLRNCSCSGYAQANIRDGTGCITWYGELVDMREFTNGGQDLYIRVAAPYAGSQDQYGKKAKGHRWEKVIIIVVVPLIGAFIIVLFCLTLIRIKAGKKPLNCKGIKFCEKGSAMGKFGDETSDVLAFELNTIEAATNTFAAENKIGEGGFGFVYKGTLANGELA